MDWHVIVWLEQVFLGHDLSMVQLEVGVHLVMERLELIVPLELFLIAVESAEGHPP